MDVDPVGARKTARQRRIQHAVLERVRARLEHSEDAAGTIALARSFDALARSFDSLARSFDALAQPGDGFANRRGMVREVVVDADSAHRAAQFEPAADPLEPG